MSNSGAAAPTDTAQPHQGGDRTAMRWVCDGPDAALTPVLSSSCVRDTVRRMLSHTTCEQLGAPPDCSSRGLLGCRLHSIRPLPCSPLPKGPQSHAGPSSTRPWRLIALPSIDGFLVPEDDCDDDRNFTVIARIRSTALDAAGGLIDEDPLADRCCQAALERRVRGTPASLSTAAGTPASRQAL